ncbi:heterodisulfide reductase-related iron-sulfur binding cluster [Prosthecobacter sp.]|uniref:(Fe-S)-binding protein n=1 Tax=Prosthecobacter sp. TaxID=1965333 RepID=UPI001D3B0795|nr:heterodisulfide reductase-related iron-sulfur binding cluster [Prosthecobacter sp.]MCB1279272.1 4Fe-4S dicluster domain-containing protein [Prosthecobacter sp.]
MLHEIDTTKLGPLGEPMAKAVSACVHCGFCLAACPTYRELGQEMDTPRGRIVLMKEVLEGKMSFEAAQPHVDRCLGCLACEPACPSGVPYRDLISPFRALAAPKMNRSPLERLRRFFAAQTVPFPNRFRLAAWLGQMGRRLPMPKAMRPMLDLIPDEIPPAQTWETQYAAQGEKRARVALLLGCAQQVLDPDINTATIEVLTRNGVEVVIPRSQGCCGGLAWHTGDLEAARSFARQNIDAFPDDVDAILTNAAGCGSAMHEYHLVLRGTPDEARAEAFRHRVMDVSVFLAKLGLREPLRETKLKAAYHDACHLSNAQNVRKQPRDLLKAIPGLQLLEIGDAHLCCGSAGSYNMDQPEIAASLGEQKAKNIIATGAEVVVTGNIGCMTQVKLHLKKLGSPTQVKHTLQVIRDAMLPS